MEVQGKIAFVSAFHSFYTNMLILQNQLIN